MGCSRTHYPKGQNIMAQGVGSYHSSRQIRQLSSLPARHSFLGLRAPGLVVSEGGTMQPLYLLPSTFHHLPIGFQT